MPEDRRRFLQYVGTSAAGAWTVAGTGMRLARGESREGDPTATDGARPSSPLAVRPAHFSAKAQRVIFLFMVGGPSQLDLFDDKPRLRELDGRPVGAELAAKMQFAQIMEKQPKLLGSRFKFARHGQSGAVVSELLPHTARIVDRVAFIKTLQAQDTPHHPAEVFLHTGSPQFGRPSLGAWINYALGSESLDLPGYVVLQSGMRPRTKGSIYASGFLSSNYQGVPLRESDSPILDLAPPTSHAHLPSDEVIDAVERLNALRQPRTGDPETAARGAAYRLASRMSAAAPEALDVRRETSATLAAYGADPTRPSFARNCLLARRLVERGVRFVHLCHGDWDHHGNLQVGLADQCRQTDQAAAALVEDLGRRGLLEETLVVWGGEFGRTPVGQVSPNGPVGRDHQISAFTMWLAGGGVRPGVTIGETDELGCFPVTEPLPIHDLQATILHLLGLDHLRVTFRHQGRDYRLTDVGGRVIRDVVA